MAPKPLLPCAASHTMQAIPRSARLTFLLIATALLSVSLGAEVVSVLVLVAALGGGLPSDHLLVQIGIGLRLLGQAASWPFGRPLIEGADAPTLLSHVLNAVAWAAAISGAVLVVGRLHQRLKHS